jgi:hypothetical protein
VKVIRRAIKTNSLGTHTVQLMALQSAHRLATLTEQR